MKTYTFKRSAIYEETYTVQAESEEQAHELMDNYAPEVERDGMCFVAWYDDEFTVSENEETQT